MIRYITGHNVVEVFLDNKFVGTIRYTFGRLWQYTPKGQKEGGEEFPSLALCKRSLEED